jgi:hypothetical protein
MLLRNLFGKLLFVYLKIALRDRHDGQDQQDFIEKEQTDRQTCVKTLM